jgi:hypothetical protein
MPTLDWLNRNEAMRIADAVPYRLLDHVSTHGDPAAGNLLIQGDNLEALKALLLGQFDNDVLSTRTTSNTWLRRITCTERVYPDWVFAYPFWA